MYEKYAKLLEEHGVSSYRVCEATGIKSATISSWKKGTYTPKINKLKLIADYFGVPVTYFLE